jgi:aryl-alcohol dehydrogenase-like predicted oxidoreductase
MQYTNLGRTGLKVSRLCLGTMNFGPRATEEESFALMDLALESGVQFFDTADVYGWKDYEGYTERIVGNWLAQGGRRDRIVLATKFQGAMGPGVNDRGASAQYIRRAVEGSLQRLRTDHLDLFQMHHVNRDTSWDEVWQAMETLVQQGKILYAGSSNHAGWHIAQANEAARRRNFLGYVSEQCKYSLACRHAELEILPACQAYGVGVLTYSPVDGGYLAGILAPVAGQACANPRATIRRQNEDLRKRAAAGRAQLEAWEGLCAQLGEKPSNVALAWVLRHPAVTAPIIGPRNREQFNDSLRALTIKLPDETLQRLDAIFPPAGLPHVFAASQSPYRYEAPEAFAW